MTVGIPFPFTHVHLTQPKFEKYQQQVEILSSSDGKGIRHSPVKVLFRGGLRPG